MSSSSGSDSDEANTGFAQTQSDWPIAKEETRAVLYKELERDKERETRAKGYQ